ncbi:pyridoxamine 5'-phosphate oxidase family protein [Mycolicibacterium goodii]|uniref:Pyridoxamine 5'-phosphate oxidase family protein n=1 Tax=Mycolicibacterium goodii TaxID=134601 RepID=A0ABS6HU16_MYCGD|nr:pyridoxamine 5'-phosphate oxidase family protein [Mycolicibacterium goodii]MBU8824842.1 pyridoxamine 5'-phosphate oxidase family protein [Mycolicibacterium goodii]MBU8839841.1 pyridoxamine 5'-phosphate oxidase family protein [Mycolicibacterium goodii]OKH75257.1 oxidoreductase [Mycobacterium sp. SWH-M5]
MEHPGEIDLQGRAGMSGRPWGSAHVGRTIPPVAAEFMRAQRLAVIGARDDAGRVWAGALTGAPGFLSARDETTVVAAAVPGPLDPLAGAFDDGRAAGMLIIDFTTRRRMRVNGTATREGHHLVIETDQVYANCPKYIQMREPADASTALSPIRTAGSELSAAQRKWIESSDTFFIATQADPYGTDASHRGGRRGFVTTSSTRGLSWPEYSGNLMYMTLGNLRVDSRAGLLFVDWDRGATLHLTGRARTDWERQVVEFDLEQVVQIDSALPLTWTFLEYSKFNPA